ncbi:hypothetical protein BH24ACT9_BH24ACT9_00810 [soil metagenome]
MVAVAAGHADALLRAWEVSAVAVTLGAGDALLSYGCGAPALVPAPPLGQVDTCGAGDSFAAAAAVALGNGALTAEAVQYAVGAASRFLAAGGVAEIGRTLQDNRFGEAIASVDTRELVGSAGSGVSACEAVRGRGGIVVATGGCFDLLHTGHIATLREARNMGDCLIVCLNSDDSVRRQKGPQRPLVSEQDRARVLLALECVDAVVIFAEDTPEEILGRNTMVRSGATRNTRCNGGAGWCARAGPAGQIRLISGCGALPVRQPGMAVRARPPHSRAASRRRLSRPPVAGPAVRLRGPVGSASGARGADHRLDAGA